MFEQGFPVFPKVFRVEEGAYVFPDQLIQSSLAIQERRRLKVNAIQVEKVKGVEDGLMCGLVAWPSRAPRAA